MVSVLDVLAGGIPQHCRLVQPAVRVVFDPFHGGAGNGEVRRLDIPIQFVDLTTSPFGIHEKRKAFFKSQRVVRLSVLDLAHKFVRHAAEFHGFQKFDGIAHLESPPLLRR